MSVCRFRIAWGREPDQNMHTAAASVSIAASVTIRELNMTGETPHSGQSCHLI
jgi:hypothetical protein